jgi:uncharacterized membrane protein
MLGMVLSLVGSLAMLVFSIQILITAFKTSVGWGLASLLLPFAIFVFVAKNWEATKTPFLRSLAAMAVVVVGTGLSVFGAVSAGMNP